MKWGPGEYSKQDQFNASILKPLNEALREALGKELRVTVEPRIGPTPAGITSGKVFDATFHPDQNLQVALFLPLTVE
jgi:hypothetical protein